MAAPLVLSSPYQKSDLRILYETALAKMGVPAATSVVEESAKSIRAGGEAGLVGGILGAAHAMLPKGLDIPVYGGQMTVPADGIGALVGLGVSAYLGGSSEYSPDIRNAGASCMSIFAFRKSAAYIAEMQAAAGKTVNPAALPFSQHAGESSIGEDPIVRAARRMASR
jgi:hypothetical protein